MNPLLEESGSHHLAHFYTGRERRKVAREGSEPRFVLILLRRLWSLIAYSDTTPTRFMLAGVCAMYCALLLLPGDTTSRPGYRLIAEWLAPDAEMKLAALWAGAAIGLTWRIFSASEHRFAGLVVNLYVFALMAWATIGIFFAASYPVAAGLAPDVACCLAAAWVLVRTHIHNPKGWRND